MLNNEILMLEEKEWKEFKISELFYVKGTKTTKIDVLKNIYTTEKQYPYVTTKATNNGVDDFFYHKTETGNVITFDSATIGYLSYQENDFSASDHVEKLIPKNFNLNKLNAHFIICAINKAIQEKFSYGFKLSQNRIKKQKLLLPINEEGQPDFEYMEQYIKKLCEKQEEKYKTYIQETLKTLQHKEIEKLEEKEWKEFKIKDVFSEIKRGKRLIKTYHKKGSIPYISSTSLNNGIDDFISNSENVRIFSKCLTIANSGSVGSCFYHRYEFIASDHVTTLKNNSFTMYVYLFVSVMTNRLSNKYSFNREINDNRILKEKLLLPTNKDGQPDFEYMEQCVKNIIYEKLKSVM